MSQQTETGTAGPRDALLGTQAPTIPLEPVVIAHPGRQHVYETVIAAQEAGLLRAFATGVFLGDQTPLTTAISAARPLFRRSMLLRASANCRHPGIDTRRVVSFPSYGIVARMLRSLPAGARIGRHMESRCDAAIAEWLLELDPVPRIVHGFEGSALSTFRVAKRLGATTVLDVPSAHEYGVAALREEGDMTDRRNITAWVRAEREHADVLLAPSAFVVQCLVENGIDPARIVEVPYGVDSMRFAPARPRTDEVFRVLHVGFVGLLKGIVYLLDAWRALDLPNAELVIAGAANANGRRLMRQHRRTVRWLGQVPRAEVHRLYAESDAFVLPSLAEGSALVTYEAMAAGLPVITTPNSGSIISDGIDGLIVPPRDAQAIARQILLLHRNPSLRLDLSRRARQTILERYTWEHYRRRVQSVYEDILLGRGIERMPRIGQRQ